MNELSNNEVNIGDKCALYLFTYYANLDTETSGSTAKYNSGGNVSLLLKPNLYSMKFTKKF